MSKRTVDFTITVRGSAVVDVDYLLSSLRKADKHPWAKHLLDIYERAGVDALVQSYIKQAYSGGVNNHLRNWKNSGVTIEEHGGKGKFAPARCSASVRPKRALYPADVEIGCRYRFASPRHGLYTGTFTRIDVNRSQSDDRTRPFEWEGHETHPIELVV